MAKVFLYGSLGREFGEKWDFSIETPKEALKALEANTGKFYKYLFEKEQEGVKYNVVVNDRGMSNAEELAIGLPKNSEIHIAPEMEGSGVFRDLGNNDAFKYGMYGLGAGQLLGWAAGWMEGGMLDVGGDVWWNPVNITQGLSDISHEVGMALVIQGLIEAVIGEPDSPDKEDDTSAYKSTSSFIFSKPANNMIQGAVVPVGYGRLRVGSSVISSSILNTRRVKFEDMIEEKIESGADTVHYTNLTK